MSNIEQLENGSIGWDKYFQYIENNKGKFSEKLYDYISNFKHYSLSDRESLHDAWLEGLLIKESDCDGKRLLNIKVVYLGPYHDRKFEFSYVGVTEYLISNSGKNDGQHGDVFVHEFSVEKTGYCHEVKFSSESVIRIYFKEMEFNQLSVD